MYYTVKEFAERYGITEHTLRYYTDIGLLPCKRDGGNRRVFDEESEKWMEGIKCLRGCGFSIEDVKKYCDLCRKEESGETLRARYEMILNARKDAYARLEEAKAVVAYMEKKVAHYESIIAGSAPDDSNPNTWTKDHKPESHE